MPSGLPPPAGGSVPWRPPMAEWACGHLLPSHSSAPEESHAPAIPTLLPGIAKELLPAGALRSNVAGTCGSPTNAPSQNAVQGFAIGSACAAAFFHRGIIPLLTLFFSASGSQKTAVTPLRGRAADAIRPAAPLRGDQLPGDPRWLSGHAGTFYPLTAPSAGHKSVLNPCRKAHRNYSLFPILYSLVSPRRNLTPRQSSPHFPGTPENCSPQGRSHLLGTVPVPAACVWVWHVRRF